MLQKTELLEAFV